MILTVNDIEVEVRAGTPADVPLLLAFIGAMAAFEKLTVSATEESLQSALFGEPPAAHALLAFVGGKPIGYATYFFSFSSMMGRRALWLDDLFIDPALRGKGIGKALMAYVAGIAVQNRCARFEWIVLDWNTSAIDFYRRLGADVLSDWRICRLDETQTARLADGLPGPPRDPEPVPSSEPDYLLESRKPEASERLAALSALFDPISLRQFDACGMAAGWRCWEVGAGGPALVRAMAERVGPSGRVLATDIDDSRVKEAAPLAVDVRRHDVAHDPPPGEGFDLVHARLVLVHLARREDALRNMMSALKPGGWLVIEDADPGLQPLSSIDPHRPEEELANRIRRGFRTLLANRGADLAFGRKLPRMFREAGMTDVAAEGYFPVVSPECARLETATLAMVRDELLGSGMATRDEIEQHLENVRSGALDLSQPAMISVRGRKPR